jgi:hypothetical protein
MAIGTLGKATMAGNHASPLSPEAGTRNAITNPLRTADTRTAVEAANQRSCCRSVPRARRTRTPSDTAPAITRTMIGKIIVDGVITLQIARSGRRATGFRTGTLAG